MPDAGGLQLLPNQKRRFWFGWVSGGGNVFFTAGMAAVVVVGIAYGVLTIFADRELTKLEPIDTEIVDIHRTRDESREQLLKSAQRQLAAVRSLLEVHPRWTETLAKLQQSLEPTVRFTSLTLDGKTKTYQFRAEADAFPTVARQIAAFYANATVKDVKVGSIGADDRGVVQFDMTITFK